jgi:hypothetical protein
MNHTEPTVCCDFCKTGRLTQRCVPVAFRQQTDLGSIACLAAIPVGVCDLCGSKNWSGNAEAITEDAVRREYVKLLSERRRARPVYPIDGLTQLISG